METIKRATLITVLCFSMTVLTQAQLKKRAGANTKTGSAICDVGAGDIESYSETMQRKATAETAVLTVDQILQNYISALGGKRAIERVSSRVSKGIYALPESFSCTEFEILQKRPNKYVFIATSPCMPGLSVLSHGFNGELHWQDILFQTGPTIIDEIKAPGMLESQIAQQYFEFMFPSEIRLKEIFPDLRVIEKAAVRMCIANVLESSTTDRKWYFDTKTGLLVAKSFSDPRGGKLDVHYLDYRFVDGINVPFIQRVFDGTNTREVFKLTGVRHNVRIDDRRFDPPAKHDDFKLELPNAITPLQDLKRPSRQP